MVCLVEVITDLLQLRKIHLLALVDRVSLELPVVLADRNLSGSDLVLRKMIRYFVESGSDASHNLVNTMGTVIAKVFAQGRRQVLIHCVHRFLLSGEAPLARHLALAASHG